MARKTIALIVVGVFVVAASAQAQLRSEVVATGFSAPVAFVQDPSDRTVQFVVEQGGRVRALKNGVVQAQPFLDLSSVVVFAGEEGLLGLAFAPDYATSRRFYVYFIVHPNGDPTLQASVVARFLRSSTDPLLADPASRFDLMWPGGQRFISQPFTNHKGGNMAFGPDGFLYLGLGDGGSGGDPLNNAQTPTTLLGKMLRLDVNVPNDDPVGYAIPGTNPYVGQAGILPQIWAFGLRNPWRWSFDDPAHGGTGALVIGDVGQALWEEIDYEPAGAGGRNYGWRRREGMHDYDLSLPAFSIPLTEPIYNYPHTVGQCITGGFVYRGSALDPKFRGRYFFADFSASRVWSLGLSIAPGTGEATATDLIEHTADLGAAASNLSSFGVDADGEIYMVAYTAGVVYRLANVITWASPADIPFGTPLGPAQLNATANVPGTFVYTPPAGTVLSPGAGQVLSVTFTPSASSSYATATRTVTINVTFSAPSLLWRHAMTGQNGAWLMNLVTIASTASLPAVPDSNWEMAATADFNGDGHDDIVWRNLATGQNVIWFLNGSTLLSVMSLPTVADRGWQIGAAIDLNGDGQPDLVWRHAVTGQDVVWFISGGMVTGTAALPAVADPTWQIVGAADFNGDGHPDLVWRNLSSGQNVVWYLDGVTFLSSAGLPPVTDLRWYIGLVGDFNGDGHPDLVWRNAQSGENVVWYLNGLTLVSTASLPTVADTAWDLAGHRARLVPVRSVSDFNLDARPDLVWRHAVTGENGIWFMTGTTRAATAVLPIVADVNWQLAATADFNGDGMADLIWRNRSTGQNAVWFMNGSTFVWDAMLPPVADTNWQIAAAADFNGDGRPDLVWRNAATGQNVVWLMDGTTIIGTASLPSVADANWEIVAATDLNGDGAPDLVWRHAVTGENVVWFMSGATLTGTASLPTLADPNWHIAMAGDFNADGKPDLVWRNYATGDNMVWFLDGVTRVGEAPLPAVADINWMLLRR